MWETRFFEKSKSPPTAEKHRVLVQAFATWLGGLPPDAPCQVLDGFAGAGTFGAPAKASPAMEAALGSPLLLLRTLREVAPLRPVRFVFVEKNPGSYGRLRDALACALGVPAAERFVLGSGSIELRHSTFEKEAGLVLARPGAVFAFVDPYGASGFTFETLARLAARGDVVLHLATRAIYTKLVTSSGASAREERRMDRLLGSEPSWRELRAAAPGLSADAAMKSVADVLARALERANPGLCTAVLALRGGETHLLHAAHGEHEPLG